MIRKLLLFTAILLSYLGALGQAVGEWNIYTRFSGAIDRIIDTPDIVYYTAGKRLFSYDKESAETYAYTSQNKLNDVDVAVVRYNPDNKYLFVGYESGNIDLLYDNGRVINLSDIKGANLNYDKGIRDITFANGRIYLGTEFGIVIFDDKKHEVVESGIFGLPVNSVVPLGDWLFINNEAGEILYAPLAGHHNTFAKFTPLTTVRASWMYPVGGNAILFDNASNGGKLSRLHVDFLGNTPKVTDSQAYEYVPVEKPMVTVSGTYFPTRNAIVYLGDDGVPSSKISLPEPVSSQLVSTWDGPKSVWGADADGIANYMIEDGKVTVLSEKYKPEGIVTDEVFFIRFDNTGAVWTGNLGVTQYKVGRNGDYFWFPQALTRIKDGHPEDMGVFVASAKDGNTKGEQQRNNTTRMMGGCVSFAIDPENPDRYFQGNNLEGVYVIENNEEIYRYDWENSPFKGYGYKGVKVVEFDPEGNLWVGHWTNDAQRSPYWVLPKSVLRSKSFEEIKTSDWLPSKHLGHDGGYKDMHILFCRKSPVIITFHAQEDTGFGVTKTNGTLGDPKDDVYFEISRTVDQDGHDWLPVRTTCAIEDQRGRVWIGTSTGLVEITDPASLDQGSRVTRIKVPRNDGTNYADYLCETDLIYDMAVDNSNRKWIATQTSGVYLVSENGDRIIEHFTKDNSPLPSNEVLSVACDPNSNTVYFGLLSGLVSYSSTSSPAAEDYSNVYAYPNPVRPDFTGYITITGLMDNSLVKITDAAGNVVHQTRSEGGMAIWDGFDRNHNPAKTGVYFVFASQNENGSSSAAVTKIMIVR